MTWCPHRRAGTGRDTSEEAMVQLSLLSGTIHLTNLRSSEDEEKSGRKLPSKSFMFLLSLATSSSRPR